MNVYLVVKATSVQPGVPPQYDLTDGAAFSNQSAAAASAATKNQHDGPVGGGQGPWYVVAVAYTA